MSILCYRVQTQEETATHYYFMEITGLVWVREVEWRDKRLTPFLTSGRRDFFHSLPLSHASSLPRPHSGNSSLLALVWPGAWRKRWERVCVGKAPHAKENPLFFSSFLSYGAFPIPSILPLGHSQAKNPIKNLIFFAYMAQWKG